MIGTVPENRQRAFSGSRIFLLCACLCMLATTSAAPIRMSKTAERKFHKKKVLNRLEKIANERRVLLPKKSKCRTAIVALALIQSIAT